MNIRTLFQWVTPCEESEARSHPLHVCNNYDLGLWLVTTTSMVYFRCRKESRLNTHSTPILIVIHDQFYGNEHKNNVLIGHFLWGKWSKITLLLRPQRLWSRITTSYQYLNGLLPMWKWKWEKQPINAHRDIDPRSR